MYGLESLQLNKEWTKFQHGKLDTFQLKGLRQILNLPTMFAQQTRGNKQYEMQPAQNVSKVPIRPGKNI